MVPGLGFPISTRGQICWLEDGHPSTVRPRTRPRITLSPTLVTRNGAPYLAIGTPGGDQQEQWILSVFLRFVHHRMTLQQAIDAPMFQTKHMVESFHPRAFQRGKVMMEDRFPEATRAELEKHLRSHGCQLYCEGGKPSAWWNPADRKTWAVPRHREINDFTARGLCRSLEVPEPF